MERDNQEIIPVDKDVLSAWRDNNAEDYAEFKEFVLFLNTENDFNKLLEACNGDLETMQAFLSIFEELVNGGLDKEKLYTIAVSENDEFCYAMCCYIYLEDGLLVIRDLYEKRCNLFRSYGIYDVVEGACKQMEDDKPQVNVKPQE